MGRNPIRLAVVAVVAVVLALAIVTGASAKSISRLPASCSGATSGSLIFARQGNQYTLGFGTAGGASAAGTWHIVFTDTGAPMTDNTLDMPATPWDLVFFRTLTRGAHTITVTADNLTTGESCTGSYGTFRV